MGFSKLGRRKALAISRLNCAAALTIDKDGVITEARIAPACIFVQPDRVEKAEQVLIGNKPSMDLFAKAGKAVAEVMIERTGVRWCPIQGAGCSRKSRSGPCARQLEWRYSCGKD